MIDPVEYPQFDPSSLQGKPAIHAAESSGSSSLGTDGCTGSRGAQAEDDGDGGGGVQEDGLLIGAAGACPVLFLLGRVIVGWARMMGWISSPTQLAVGHAPEGGEGRGFS